MMSNKTVGHIILDEFAVNKSGEMCSSYSGRKGWGECFVAKYFMAYFGMVWLSISSAATYVQIVQQY